MLKVGQPRPVLGAAPVAARPVATPAQPQAPEALRAPGLEARAATVHEGPQAGGGRGVFRRLRLDHLTSGKRFDPRCTEALVRITGHAITLDGLARAYEKALPSHGVLAAARVRVTGAVERDGFAYTVTFVDNMQRRIATTRRRLVRGEDGALELYQHGTWLDEDQRGRGFAARMLKQELGLLSALSEHPDTRMTLWAGGARDPHRGVFQSLGTYVWAKAGFALAADPSPLAAGPDKPRCEDDPGREALGDLALMRRQLLRWVEGQVAAGAVTPEAAAAAEAAVLETPQDFAGLGPGGLGRAFLLSDAAPRWPGVLYVNRGGLEQAEAWVQAALTKGGEAELALGRSLQEDLRSGDDDRVRAALAHVGRAGGAAFVEPLLALEAARPELAEAVKDALLKVRGRWSPPKPKVTYTTHGGRAQAFTLPPQFAELARHSPPKLASLAASDPDFRLAQAALQQLADKHLDKAPKTVADAAAQLFARFTGDDDRWLARQAAVQVLARIPSEGGVPALIEASKVEDDINVMIAIHRALEGAEHPAAVEPSEVLGLRIEALKAEIERALAEL
ncbi:MAG: hypothetical protein H6730_12940 [Deltaproteobacteria bacterium]|nr:hypothetical protein [Deltaproteobacteria bacterium]